MSTSFLHPKVVKILISLSEVFMVIHESLDLIDLCHVVKNMDAFYKAGLYFPQKLFPINFDYKSRVTWDGVTVAKTLESLK